MPSLENKVVTHITLYADASTQNRPPYVYAKQYDANSRYLVVRIVDSNKDIAVTGAAQLNATKPDGTHSYIAGTANEDGTVTIGLTANLLAVEGKVSCDITVFDSADGDQALLTTSTFFILVDESNYDSDAIESTDEFSTVSDALTKIAADRAAAESARDEAVSAAEEVQTTLATKADGLVLDGSRLYLTSGGQEIDGSSVEIVTDLTEVYEAIGEKADGFVIEDSKLYLTSEGVKITEGISITTDLTAVYSAIARKADSLVLDGNKLQLMSGTTPLGAAIELPTGVSDLTVEGEKLYLLTDDGERIGSGVSLPAQIDDLMTEVEGDNTKLYLSKNGEPIGDGVILPSGGGGGGVGSIRLRNLLPSTNFSVPYDSTATPPCECVLNFSFTSTDEFGDDTGNGTLYVYANSILKMTIQNYTQGEHTLDVGSYLDGGRTNTIKLTAVDSLGNTRSLTYTITAVQIYITSDFPAISTQTGTFTLSYTPTGSGSKLIHFELDGEDVATATVTSSGREVSQDSPASAHGGHILRVYMEMTLEGYAEPITSNVLTFGIVAIEADNDTPIVLTTHQGGTVNQYDTLSIPYMVYIPGASTVPISRTEDGVVVSSVTAASGVLYTWSYRPMTSGDHTLEIVYDPNDKVAGDEVKATIELYANYVEVVQAESAGLDIHLDSSNRSNDEANPAIWSYTNASEETYAAQFNNFRWTTDGWIVNDDGVVVCRVPVGGSVDIPYKPFATDVTSQGGKTLEFNFRVRRVYDYDTSMIVCTINDKGINITAQEATLQINSTDSLAVQFKDNEDIRLSLVISKRDTSNSERNQLIYMYVNGVISGMINYSSNDSFTQSTPQSIHIGSDHAAIDLYTIRGYHVGLSSYQILDNFVADTPLPTLMLSRNNRNDIFDSNNEVDYDKLPSDLPYFVFECPRLSEYKGDKIEGVAGRYVDPLHPERSFTFTGAQINVQGTSSQYYFVKNFKVKFKNGVIDKDGNVHEDWPIYEGAIGEVEYCFKADVASSESANNVVLMKLWDDMTKSLGILTNAQQKDSRHRQSIYGFPMVVFWYNTNEDGTDMKPDGETTIHYAPGLHFQGKYNFNNEKADEKTFGFGVDPETYPNQQCWEFRDNGLLLTEFRSDDFDSTYVDEETGEETPVWKAAFEGRYPDKYEDTTLLRRLVSWVNSTDTRQATGAALGAAITYDGVTYTTDTAEYRLAKFKNQFEDYFYKNSLLAYYLFTEVFLMTDSRAKNLFLGTDDGYHWMCYPYDGDTALGIDNLGRLKFGYELEDTDQVNGNNVYNGAPSTLWLNIKACFQSELAEMAGEMVTAGLTYDAVRKRFDDHQGAWPEAIFCQDTNVKYVNPWLLTGDKDNILRAQGSKKAQRDYWLYYRYYYWCSKYMIGAAKNEYIMMRVSKPDTSKPTTQIVVPTTDLNITPFSHIYLNVGFGQNVIRQKATKNVESHFTSTLTGDYADTPITVYAASQIKDLGDLSPAYLTSCDISRAANLQRLVVGNPKEGYRNESLTSISLGNNTKLKLIDVRNCVNLTGNIAAGQCENIEEIYAENSSISSVTLPVGGDLRVIHLPETTNAIAIRKHLNLEDFSVAGTDRLTSLYIEECPGVEDDILALVQSATNLTNVRLANINWNLDSTDLLDRLLTLGGKSEDGSENTDQSYLSGTVHVPLLNTSRQRRYEEAWGDLTVTYDTFLEEYPVTFKNEDGSILDVQWVVRGSAAVDPVTRADNPIDTPTKASTVDTNFHYAGWDSEAYLEAIYGAVTITATYTTSVRYYTIRWYVEGVLKQETSVPYGSGAEYTGETPVKADNAAYDIYYLFSGWDKNSYRIYADTDVNAVFVTGATPAAPSDPDNKPALSSRSVEEINAICKSGQKDWETVYKTGEASSFEQKYFDVGDEIDITLGWEPNDEESNAHLIFDLETSKSVLHYNTDTDDAGTEVEGVTLPITFNQEDGDPTYLDTGVKLMYNNGVPFGEDDDCEFTFVIDFAGNDVKLADGTTSGEGRVLDCMGSSDGYEHGFKLYQVKTSGAMTLQYAASTMAAASARNIASGSYLVTDPDAKTYTTTTEAMLASFLERLIVRKKKGERGVTVYKCNPNGTTHTTHTLSYSGDNRVPHERTIWLGCGRSAYGYINAGTLANCTIYNFKVWDVAMSDLEMAKMALTPKEKQTFRLHMYPRTQYGVSGSYNYLIKTGDVTADNPNPAGIYPGIALGMKNLMRNYRTMNSTNVNNTGWENSLLRSWLGSRVYNALPQIWRSAIKTVNVRASAGGGASTPPDSAYEIVTSRDNLFLWSTREYGGYSGSPYDTEGTQISLYTNDASRRKYQEYGHKKIYWYYWTRSPYLLSSAYFCGVGYGGYCYASTAYYSSGVSAGFCL